MTLELCVGDATDELAALYEWLRREPDLRPLVQYTSGTPKPGTLAAGADILIAAVSSGGAISVLAASIKGFITLPRRSDFRLTIKKTADETYIDWDAKRVKATDIAELTRELAKLIDGGK